MKKTALLILTLDIKAEEALFLKKALEQQGLNVLIMDVGVFPSWRDRNKSKERE
jgi:uncharacterized protein (UPF0261 family)